MYYQRRVLARELKETNEGGAYLVDASLGPQEEDERMRVAYSAWDQHPNAMSLGHERATTIADSEDPTTTTTTSDTSEKQKKADEGARKIAEFIEGLEASGEYSKGQCAIWAEAQQRTPSRRSTHEQATTEAPNISPMQQTSGSPPPPPPRRRRHRRRSNRPPPHLHRRRRRRHRCNRHPDQRRRRRCRSSNRHLPLRHLPNQPRQRTPTQMRRIGKTSGTSTHRRRGRNTSRAELRQTR
jgi:hypothetical protein